MSIGTTSNTDQGKRDAFHVPCVLVATYHYQVEPGSRVRFANKECTVVEPDENGPADGIADPFLERIPCGGHEYFWMFLLPGKSSNLRHHFDLNVDTESLPPEASLFDDGCRGCY